MLPTDQNARRMMLSAGLWFPLGRCGKREPSAAGKRPASQERGLFMFADTPLRSRKWKSFDVTTLDCARKSLAYMKAAPPAVAWKPTRPPAAGQGMGGKPKTRRVRLTTRTGARTMGAMALPRSRLYKKAPPWR